MIVKYNEKRPLVSVDEFMSKTGTKYLMCVDEGMLYIIRKLIKDRALWYTTYVKDWYESGYETANANDMDIITDVVSEFIQESEVIKMCNTALINAITDIAEAVRGSACCDGSGPGFVEYGGSYYYGNEEPLDPPTAFGVGEEFETEAEWLSHKCDAANAIVDGLINTLNNFAVLSLASLTAAAIILAVASPVISPVPLAVFVALGLTGFLFGGFHTLANAIDDNRQELVCLVFDANGAIEAYDDLHDAIHDLEVDLGFLAIEISALDAVMEQLTPIDTFNAMYTAIGLPAIGQSVTCDSCETVCSWQIIYGSGVIETDGTPFVVTSEDNGTGAHVIALAQTEACCNENDTVELVSWTGSPDNGFGVFQWDDCPDEIRIVTQSSPSTGVWQAMKITQVESAAGEFTFTLKITV